MIETFWTILTAILHASCRAAVVALLITGIQLSLGRRLSPNWRIALWSLVIIRLITPTLPATRFSLLNLLQSDSPEHSSAAVDPEPTITFGIITDAPTPVSYPAPTIAKPISHAPNWRLFAIGLWALGTFALVLRMAISQIILFHRLRSNYPVEDVRICDLLEECRRTLHGPPIKCVEANWISAPALCGLFHPTLLLPPVFSHTLSDSDLRFILMHELIHARRHDLLIDRLIALIVASHWFNPAAWLAWRRIRTERELACDQAVLRSTAPSARLDYGQTLLTIAERLMTPPNSLLSIGVADRHCSMRRRLLAIVQPPRQWKFQSLIGALFIAIIGFAAFTSAEPSPPSTTAASQPTTTPTGMVVRTYDIATLLISVPHFESPLDFSPTFGHPPSSRSNEPRPTTQQIAEGIISDIQSHIDPPSWKSASISESDGKLLVTQTPANQDAIWQYLSSRIGDRSTLVTVETRLLCVTPRIIANWKTRHPSKPLTSESTSFTKTDVDELLQMYLGAKGCSLITAPRIHLFSGQRSYIEVAASQAYVRDLHTVPSTTHPTQPDFVPDIGTAQSGVLLDVRPIVSADRQYVTLELNDEASDLLAMKAVPWPQAPRGRSDLTIQVPTIRTEAIKVSVSIPNDGYFISPATETTGPGTAPPSKFSTLVIVHATFTTSSTPDNNLK